MLSYAMTIIRVLLFCLLLASPAHAALSIAVVQAYINTSSTTAVSASFDIADGDLIIAVYHADQTSDLTIDSVTLTDNDGDLAFTGINLRGSTDSGAGFVGASSYNATRADTGVVVTITAGLANDTPYLKIYRITGHDTADPIGALNEGDLTTDPQSASLTMETAGGFFAAWTDWNQTGTPTSSDLTETGFDDAGDISGGSGYKVTAVGAQTGDMNSGGTPTGNWIAFEIRDGGGAAPSPKRLLTLGAGD